jgi:CotS family spore coat protein
VKYFLKQPPPGRLFPFPITHQDYGWSNGQVGPGGGIWIIDLDGVAFDLPIRDLRKLITSTMDDMGSWDLTWMRGMIDAYNQANPIEPDLMQVLLIDMALPNEFYKHVKAGVTKTRSITSVLKTLPAAQRVIGAGTVIIKCNTSERR